MQHYSQDEAIQRMNRLGQAHAPFFFAIDFEMNRCIVEPLADLNPDECLFRFKHLTNEPAGIADVSQILPCEDDEDAALLLKPVLPSFETYQKAFQEVKSGLLRGDSFLCNLTCRVPISTTLSLPTIYQCASAPYKLWLKDTCVCFSPEPFVHIDENEIRSFPMKGTIADTDSDSLNRLMNNAKEQAEHATIVDLIRNDLSIVATDVQVEHYRYAERIEASRGAIWQTSSAIKGTLPQRWRDTIGTLMFKLLPAGSITGAPKRRTVEIIQSAEGIERGYYTGVMGCFMDDVLLSSVMIRFVEQGLDGKLYYRAGGGITANSDARAEYEEINQKIYVPLR